MIERHSYIGKVDGVAGIWCDQKPGNIELERVVDFYVPDDGCVFVKDKQFFDSVVIEDGVDIAQFVEIQDPRNQEEPKEESDETTEND